ncbi:hypothetical protein ZIOFF_065435 [Zingiber officinale]|uniref:Stomagen C-terminal domain-containing protein n=1 Tax=Zingiber officinale TaxID=94328 RepID=A0A8J5EX48_ZINOF|nr:hypothetical protein ZIOFF_065435 [Zingiber officinale]
MQHYIQWGTSNSLVACMGTSYSPGPFLLSPFHLFFFPIPSNFFNSTGESMAMASTSFLLFYFLLSTFLLSPFSHLTGFEGRVTTDHSSLLPLHKVEMASGGMTSGELIGSMAPICTYNECRGDLVRHRLTGITSFAAISIVDLIQSTPAVLVSSFM